MNKAVGSERAMNENALVLEQKNIFLEEEIARLQQQGVRDFEKLARERNRCNYSYLKFLVVNR